VQMDNFDGKNNSNLTEYHKCKNTTISSPSPLFGPYLLWPNGRPSQQLLSSCLRHSIVLMCKCLPCAQDRPSGGLTAMKLPFAKDHAPIEQLVDVVTTVKPTAIIGSYCMVNIVIRSLTEVHCGAKELHCLICFRIT